MKLNFFESFLLKGVLVLASLLFMIGNGNAQSQLRSSYGPLIINGNRVIGPVAQAPGGTYYDGGPAYYNTIQKVEYYTQSSNATCEIHPTDGWYLSDLRNEWGKYVGPHASMSDMAPITSLEIPSSITAYYDSYPGYSTTQANIEGVRLYWDGVDLSAFGDSIEIILPASVKYLTGRGLSKLNKINLGNVQYIGVSFNGSGEWIVFENNNLHEVDLRSAVYIGGRTFSYSKNLKEVTLYHNMGSNDSLMLRNSNYGHQFSYCKALKKVTLKDEITTLPYGCFWGCDSLSEVNLKNVTKIGYGAFENCKSLVIDTIYHNMGDDDLVLTTYYGFQFYGCKALKKLTLSNEVTTIPYYCFASCSNLSEINLKNITKIGSYALEGCNSLVIDTLDWTNKTMLVGQSPFTGVTLKFAHLNANTVLDRTPDLSASTNRKIFNGVKNSIIYIEDTNPAYWSKADLIGDLPNSSSSGDGWHSKYVPRSYSGGQYVYGDTAEIAANQMPTNYIFVPASALETWRTATGWSEIADRIMPWPPRYVIIDGQEEYGNGLTFVDDANTKTTRLTHIGSNTGGNVLEIPELFLDGYRTVGVADCSGGNWNKVVLPVSVTTLSESAFANCINLDTINLNHITTLEGHAFNNCTSLTKVEMPMLTKMTTSDFKGCNALETVKFASLPVVPQMAFQRLPELQTVILDAVDSIKYQAFMECPKLTSVTTSTSGDALKFPSTLKFIGKSAFARSPLTGALDLPNGITKVDKFAFRETHISSLYLPSSLVTPSKDIVTLADKEEPYVDFEHSSFAVDSAAFDKNYYLQRIDVAEGINGLGNSVFQFCPNLKFISLPNTVKYIGAHFVCGAKELESLTIPASVTDIDGAFLHGCQKLRNVYLLGNPSMLKTTSRGGESFGPVDFNDDWPAHSDIHCKHVNDCLFTVNDEGTYNGFITYVNNDGEKPWLRLDRYDFDYNLAGSDNNGTLTNDHIDWTAKKYYKTVEHIADFPRNKGLDGNIHENAYENAKADIYGSSAPSLRALRRISPAQKETYKDLYTLTGYHNRYNYFPVNTTITLPSPAPKPDDPELDPTLYDKWSTICFPFKPVKSELDALIGENAIIAEYVSSRRVNPGQDAECLYELSFQTINHDDIVADKPYLIRPSNGQTVNIPMYDSEKALAIYGGETTSMTPEHWTKSIVTVHEASNEPGTDIYMIGSYLDYLLSQAEFYLNNSWDNTDDAWAMKFYKAKADNVVKVKPFKCFFRIVKHGVPIRKVRLGSMINIENSDGSVTAIGREDLIDDDATDMEGTVYNLKGEKVANRLNGAQLPAGVYIVNGRKILIGK